MLVAGRVANLAMIAIAAERFGLVGNTTAASYFNMPTPRASVTELSRRVDELLAETRSILKRS